MSSLTSLEGLGSLRRVGTLSIIDNNNLPSLRGLMGSMSGCSVDIGHLEIRSNSMLADMNGVEHIRTAGTTVREFNALISKSAMCRPISAVWYVHCSERIYANENQRESSVVLHYSHALINDVHWRAFKVTNRPKKCMLPIIGVSLPKHDMSMRVGHIHTLSVCTYMFQFTSFKPL